MTSQLFNRGLNLAHLYANSEKQAGFAREIEALIDEALENHDAEDNARLSGFAQSVTDALRVAISSGLQGDALLGRVASIWNAAEYATTQFTTFEQAVAALGLSVPQA